MTRSALSGRSGGPTGPVTARVLHALSAFTAETPALTLSDIARRSATPVATTHRYMKELEEWGAVTRDSEGVYRIGLRLWQIGMLCTQTEGLREVALPYLEDLTQLTRENVQLAVLEDTEAVFVERLAGSRAVPVLTKVGANWPTTTTSAGLLLLAHAPHDVQDTVLSRPIKKFTEKTLIDVAQIRRELALIRSQGFSISDRQVSMEALSISAPIVKPGGSVIAALSLVVAAEGASVHSLTPLVRTSARAISRALNGARI
jgi:DNA-binding IclR family transcriptional regulator